jgi:hypothetical protein
VRPAAQDRDRSGHLHPDAVARLDRLHEAPRGGWPYARMEPAPCLPPPEVQAPALRCPGLSGAPPSMCSAVPVARHVLRLPLL